MYERVPNSLSICMYTQIHMHDDYTVKKKNLCLVKIVFCIWMIQL